MLPLLPLGHKCFPLLWGKCHLCSHWLHVDTSVIDVVIWKSMQLWCGLLPAVAHPIFLVSGLVDIQEDVLLMVATM